MNAQTGAPAPLEPGDAAPVFAAAGPGTPHYFIRQASGAPAVLCFFGSAGDPRVSAMLETVRNHALFDGKSAAFIGISADRDDLGRLTDSRPGFRILWDFDRRIAALCGFAQGGDPLKPRASIVFDRRLRVLKTLPLDPEHHLGAVIDVLTRFGDSADDDVAGGSAPVLMVPRVFEPEFCRKLIADCAGRSGDDSGFMSTDPVTGNTVLQRDHEFKRRRDFTISDAAIRIAIHQRLLRRLLPEIDKAFEFRATRIERYLVACYDSAVGGYFGPHRDNGTRATAHRRFAVTINLNAEAYEGGDLRFPEFDGKTFRAPTGGAAVFACSLTHEVVPMIGGTRYCFLPFLYDELSAQLREENLKYLAQENSGRAV
jgi:peroxiredoxin